MKYLLLLALFVVSHFAMAEQGLVVGFSIEEYVTDSQDTTSSTSNILMGLNETVSVEVEGDYVVTMTSKQLQAENIQLTVSLSDLSNGAPNVVDKDRTLKLAVGQTTRYKLAQAEHVYQVSIDTVYGELPAN
ncbi:hypothetical protein [Shewanella saliphila]|uniref:Uncharacterized protein n=1 Tax=Shewanella saliphila TaxID=2282698 RepID=A0ABQ2Q6G0_9GAMM|nr:hypothetical protein [Shewanella saliphila]MCL1102280.1 hypothetical protein [Shewanella saliphila]GGP55561.1 hypothetical protein GCM10009409_22170 [Shewanella saliphila]